MCLTSTLTRHVDSALRMTHTTKALIADKPGASLRLGEIVVEDPRADEALVEIKAVGICHAELSCLNGVIPVPFPIVLGHEGAGIVMKVGSRVEGFVEGQKVLLSFNHCRKCRNCKNELPGYCVQMLDRNWSGSRPDGSKTLHTSNGQGVHGSFFGQSSFSRLALVNASCLVKIPQTIPLELFAPLGCGVQTGFGTVVNTLNVDTDSSITVFGAGAVGLSAVMAARSRGATPIIAVDLNPQRLQLARELGATHVLQGGKADLIQDISRVCAPYGLQYAIDTTGSSAVVEAMICCLGVRGRAVCLGSTGPGKTAQFDVTKHLNMGKHVLGSVAGDSCPQKMIPFLLEQYSHGRLPLEKIVRLYRVEDFADAFADMESGRTVKPVLVWS